MFKQPTEKRKNAATSVNLSTWWERIVAPMLKGKSAFELSSDEHCNQEERDYSTYSAWKIPSGPRPN